MTPCGGIEHSVVLSIAVALVNGMWGNIYASSKSTHCITNFRGMFVILYMPHSCIPVWKFGRNVLTDNIIIDKLMEVAFNLFISLFIDLTVKYSTM